MATGEAAAQPAGGYEVRMRFGWVMAARVAALVAIVFAAVHNPVNGHVTRGSVAYACVLAVWGLFFVGQQYALRRRGCLLRIDAAGVTVSGEPTVVWGELRKAEVWRGGALVFFSWSSSEKLPLLPVGLTPGRAAERRHRKRLVKRFGSVMVVPTRLYGVRRAELVAAVRHYGGTVPVFE